ncbi:MAG: protein kinase [Kofleriaceae bacterium]
MRHLLAIPLIACLAAIAIIVAFALDRTPAPYALAALGVVAVAYLPFVRASRPSLQIAGLIVFGLCTLPVGWMFGTNAACGALFTLVILLVGVRYSAAGSLAFYLTVAVGQAAVTTVVLAGVLPDESILALVVPNHPMWHHAIAHVALQGLYATAFFAGRGFQARYRRLSSDLDAAIQIAARRASLLDEARAEYLRTLALGRQGIFSGHTIGSFRLGELIGRGGAGEVYDARADDGAILAVKLLRGDRLRDPAAVQSFIAETNAAMRIDDPHVVRAKQVGGLDDSIPFIAMEKLDGTDLRALLAERGALSRDALRELATDAAAALSAVHAAGLAHGDVSPQNLVKTNSGWKLIDFGARAAAGTPRFVAPELIANPELKPTPSSDLYGLAACLYAATTGDDPFVEIEPRHLAHAVANRMPMDPRLHADVSDDVARALQIGLAADPSSRFTDAATLCTAFVAALDHALDASLRTRATSLPAWSIAPPIDEHEPEPTDEVARAARASEPATRADASRASQPAIRASQPAIRASQPAIRASQPAIRASQPAIRANEPIEDVRAPNNLAIEEDRSLHEPAERVRAPDNVAIEGDRPLPISSGRTRDPDGRPRTPAIRGSERELDATRDAAWEGAFRDKARRQRAGVLTLCIGGAILLGFIIREREALWAAWIGIAGIAVTTLFHRSAATWPWVIVGVLSVGPAFALGLHSAFAAVVALGLFAGRMFRAPWRTASRSSSWRTAMNNDWLILVAIVVAHTIAFSIVATGVIADDGNTPVSYVGLSPAIGWCLHAIVMGTYVAVFATAAAIDRNFDQLVKNNEVALRDAAQKEALLSTARDELERALAGETGGLFTGTTIGGYVVEKLIGRGGMGEVYEARRDGAAVALKVIRADKIQPENLRRFAREASALRQVDSPYVARVLEIGSDERVPFLAMELVEGVTLAELLRESERLDVTAARSMVRDISRGLEDVHRASVLHRDVKPSNLVRTATGWKLVDFGVAKFLDAPSETTGNLVIGTPPFMAPEQLTGAAIDERSDIFSFCAVIYRAMTGRSAWTTATALAAKRTQPADPTGAVSTDVACALRIGLATRREDRFASCVDLGAAFDAAFDGRLDDGYRRRALGILAREPWS